LRRIELVAGQEFNQFVENIPDWSGWLATLVSNEDGLLVGRDGNSKGIGNQVDLQLLMALRSKADVICTTGKTARAEAYKASRFAPLAFLTKSKESLKQIPALIEPGPHENIFLLPQDADNAFIWAAGELNAKGLTSVLFEGGPSSLRVLWSADLPIQLVFSIANCQKVDEVDALEILGKALPWLKSPEIVDDIVIGPNRVTRWVKSPL
jgi:riboflavin biosynthesis pyrimidine reductase